MRGVRERIKWGKAPFEFEREIYIGPFILQGGSWASAYTIYKYILLKSKH